MGSQVTISRWSGRELITQREGAHCIIDFIYECMLGSGAIQMLVFIMQNLVLIGSEIHIHWGP